MRSKAAGVYKVPCHDCDLTYIGETGRDLETLIQEHKYAIRTANCGYATFKHVSEKNHTIDWGGSYVLYKCNNYRKTQNH